MNTKHAGNAGFSTISLLVVLGAAIFLGIGVYIMSKGTTYDPLSSPRSTAKPAQQNTSELTNGEVTSTLPDIVSYGQSLECDFKIPVSAAQNPFNNGKLWTTGSKGRSTINAAIAGMEMEANAIYQNNTAYTWITVGGQKIGMKFSPESLNDATSKMTPQERQQAEQVRASMIFNCHPWAPDETKFILPSDVQFDER